MKSRRTAMATAISAVIFLAACSGSAAEPATTTEPLPRDLPALEFGTGVLPVTVPLNFPIPEPSAITTTMIDGSRELTEVAFNVGGALHDVSSFYTTNLPNLGYEITEVSDEGGGTTIVFIGHGIDGAVTLKVAGQNVTAGTLIFVYA